MLTAKVHYELLPKSRGIYLWLDPDELSVIKILNFMDDAPFKHQDGTELHCTVLYHKDSLPESVVFPKDQAYKAYIVGLDHWIDHKQRNILVLRLSSPDLLTLNADLCTYHLKHSFSVFRPHITIAKQAAMDANDRLWIDAARASLAVNPIAIAFSRELRATSIS